MTTSSPVAELPLRLRMRRARRAVRRVLLARRRLLAAALAGLAVLAAVRAVAPPPAPTVDVLVAGRDLAPGTRLTAGDLEVRTVAAALAPASGVPPPAEVVGRVVAGPVGAGEPVSRSRLVGAGLAAAAPGRATLPVRLADAAAVGLLRAGDRVDLVAADLQGGPGAVASPVASAVDVLAVPASPAPDAVASGAVGGATLPGSLVVVAVDPADVAPLTQASAAGFVTFTWTAP